MCRGSRPFRAAVVLLNTIIATVSTDQEGITLRYEVCLDEAACLGHLEGSRA